MDEASPDNEALIELDKAELVVPLDAICAEQKHFVDTNTVVDPTEFFDFLDNFDNWPTNGLRLAEAAERQGYSRKLAHFFEGMPGSFGAEGDVMPYAEDPSRPPFGAALEAAPHSVVKTEDPGELTISDITQGLESSDQS